MFTACRLGWQPAGARWLAELAVSGGALIGWAGGPPGLHELAGLAACRGEPSSTGAPHAPPGLGLGIRLGSRQQLIVYTASSGVTTLFRRPIQRSKILGTFLVLGRARDIKTLASICAPQVVVVVNKVDRPAARCDWVIDQTFELFLDLGASDEQCGEGT